MLRQLPVAAPDELQFVAIGLPGGDGDQLTTASNYPWFERVRQRTDVFAGVTAFNIRDFKVASDDGAERVVGQYVSGNYHGWSECRWRSDAGSRPKTTALLAAVRLPSSATATGRVDSAGGATSSDRRSLVGGRSLTIVGVTAPGFEGMQPGRSIEITLPLSIRIQDEPDFLTWLDSWTSMPLVVRLKPGVDVRQAEAVLQSVFREHMSRPETRGFSRTPDGQLRTAMLLPAARGHDRLRNDYDLPLAVLMGMVGVVLLIACINVANLLFVRGTARASGSGRAHVGRCKPRPPGATVPDREPRARDQRRRHRPHFRGLGHTTCRHAVPREPEPDRDRRPARRRGAALRSRARRC